MLMTMAVNTFIPMTCCYCYVQFGLLAAVLVAALSGGWMARASARCAVLIEIGSVRVIVRVTAIVPCPLARGYPARPSVARLSFAPIAERRERLGRASARCASIRAMGDHTA